MVRRVVFLIMLALSILSMPAIAQSENLSAFVDRNQISINDVFTLTVRVESTLTDSLPQLTGLDDNFELIGTARSNNYTNVNGVVQAWREYRISLRPKAPGTLTIPSFTVAGETTDPIQITVTDAPRNPVNLNDEIYLTTTVSKDEIYVQEQLLYTVKLYYRTGFDQGAQLSAPQVPNAVIQQLGNDQNYQEIIDGIRYSVTERTFVIFPQSSGNVEIRPITFNATVGRRRSSLNSFFSNRGADDSGREVNLRSEAHSVNVLPKPAAFPEGATWLPASNLTLEEQWSGSTDDLAVGESVTRNLTLTAEGLSSSLLPDFDYEDTDGLRFYPDQPRREDVANQNGVTGMRTQGAAIVPSRAGDFTLPTMEIPWWNTTTDALEFARLPSRSISVTGAAAMAPNTEIQPGVNQSIVNSAGSERPTLTAASSSSQVSFYWIGIALLFAAAWVFSTTMWMRDRQLLKSIAGHVPAMPPGPARDNEKTPAAGAAFKSFRQACGGTNLPDIRRSLLTWGQVYFNDPDILTLEDLRRRIPEDGVRKQLHALESALYSPGDESAFEPQTLLREISAMKKTWRNGNGASKAGYSLPPLYKN